MFNTRNILIGVLLLAIGPLVYLIDRPPDQTYLIFILPFRFSLYDALPPLFGYAGNFLPHFLHVAAFILLTAGVLNCGKRGYLFISLFWLITCVAFELGQKHADQAAALVPDWFAGIFLLENTRNYFFHGTYCRLDIAAIVTGSLLAYAFLIFTDKKGARR